MKAIHATILLKLAWRNLWRHKTRTTITLISITLGFSLAVIFIGIGDGSHQSMIRNAIQMGEGHLAIQPQGYLTQPSNHKLITDGKQWHQHLLDLNVPAMIAPRIHLQVLANTAYGASSASLQGVASNQDPRTIQLKPQIITGNWLQLEAPKGIVIGQKLANRLKAKVGSKIVVMAGQQDGNTQAHLARVQGVFKSGIAEIDGFLMISNLDFARQFFSTDPAQDPVTLFAIFLHHDNNTQHWLHTLETLIETQPETTIPADLQAVSWQQMMPQLVQFIAVDDVGNYVFLTLILVMVIFGIINTVLMSVLERTREFGLLRALGLQRLHLMILVFFESLLLSLLAIAMGWLVGGTAHLWFAHAGIDFSAIMPAGTTLMGTMMDPVIYTHLSGSRVLQLTTLIFIATLGSGLYPAIKSARIAPVAALKT